MELSFKVTLFYVLFCFFRQEFHFVNKCDDLATSDRHPAPSHQDHCGWTSAAET